MKKALLSLLFLALAAFGPPALAQAPLTGFYVGASGGLAEARSSCSTNWLPAGTTIGGCEEKDFGWKVYGGYQFTPHWGAEVGYLDFGKQKWGVAIGGAVQATAEAEAKAWTLVGTGTLPLIPGSGWSSPAFSIFGKIGLYRSDTDVRAGGISANGRSTDWTWGVGAKWDFTRNVSMRIEWERLNNTGNNTIGTTDLEMLSIGAMFRF
jgi:OOP family OmpA-OmpF porin